MAKQVINVGLVEGDKTGDKARDAFIKVNENFDELYTAQGSSSSTSSPIEEPIDIYDLGTVVGAKSYSKTVSIFDQAGLDNDYGIIGLEGIINFGLLDPWYGGNQPTFPNTVDFLLIPTSETEVVAILMDNYELTKKQFIFSMDADNLNDFHILTRNDISTFVGDSVVIPWAFTVPDISAYPLSGDFTLKTQEYIKSELNLGGAFGYDNINIEGLKYCNAVSTFGGADGFGLSTAPKFIFKDLLFIRSMSIGFNPFEAPKLVWAHNILADGFGNSDGFFDISLPSLKYIGSHKKTSEVFSEYENNNSSLSFNSIADENQTEVVIFAGREFNLPSLVSLSCRSMFLQGDFTSVVLGTTDTLKYVRPGIEIIIDGSFDPSALDSFFISLAGVLDYFNWCSTSIISVSNPNFTEPLESFGSSAEAEAAYFRMINAGLTYNF